MTEFEQKKIFSNNLSSLLEDRQLTQREVADSIGVSAQTFNTWCRGVAIPRMDKIQKLADYFCVEKSTLIDPPDLSDSSVFRLTASEISLLSSFRRLNNEGQELIMKTCEGLVASGQYEKSGSSIGVGESA